MKQQTPLQLLVFDILRHYQRYEWKDTTEGVFATYFYYACLNLYCGLDKENKYIHSHPFDFESVIVVGELQHTRYKKSVWGNVYSYQDRKLTGEFIGDVGTCHLLPDPIEVYRPGQCYTVCTPEIHSVDPMDGTLTFVTRRSYTTPTAFASYWPEGKPTAKVGDGSFALRTQSKEEVLKLAVEKTLDTWRDRI